MFNEYTILLVEDDIDTQEYLKLIFLNECKELFIASDGEEGLEKYKKYNPDMIITDLNMPKKNGIAMSREIKSDNSFQPIILLTAFGEVEELKEAINIGVNAFISKPIGKIDILFNTMHKLLNNSDYIKEVNKAREIKTEKESQLTSLLGKILHDDNEYIDYEALEKDIT